jgi:hypothetical protein
MKMSRRRDEQLHDDGMHHIPRDNEMMNCFCRSAITISFHKVRFNGCFTDCDSKFHTFLQDVSVWPYGLLLC